MNPSVNSNKNFYREGAKTANKKIHFSYSGFEEGHSQEIGFSFEKTGLKDSFKKATFFAAFAPSRLKLFLGFAFLLMFVSGCASIGIRDSSLQLQITPQPVMRGKPALAQINAPMDAQKVTGVVLVTGSPRLIFRKDEDKGLWYFYGTIPFSPWVLPGDYNVRVMVYPASDHDQPHYAEMKVTLK